MPTLTVKPAPYVKRQVVANDGPILEAFFAAKERATVMLTRVGALDARRNNILHKLADPALGTPQQRQRALVTEHDLWADMRQEWPHILAAAERCGQCFEDLSNRGQKQIAALYPEDPIIERTMVEWLVAIGPMWFWRDSPFKAWAEQEWRKR